MKKKALKKDEHISLKSTIFLMHENLCDLLDPRELKIKYYHYFDRHFE